MGNFFLFWVPKYIVYKMKCLLKKKLNLIFINNWPNYNLQTKQQINVIAFIHQIRKE